MIARPCKDCSIAGAIEGGMDDDAAASARVLSVHDVTRSADSVVVWSLMW